MKVYTSNELLNIQKSSEHEEKFLPIAKQLFFLNLGEKIQENCNFFTHKKHKWLTSFLDVITKDGTLIDFNVCENISFFDIFPKIQLDLEITELSESNLVEYFFEEYSCKEDFLEDKKYSQKGGFIKMWISADRPVFTYIFPNSELLAEDYREELVLWLNSQLKTIPELFGNSTASVKADVVWWKVKNSKISSISKINNSWSSILDEIQL